LPIGAQEKPAEETTAEENAAEENATEETAAKQTTAEENALTPFDEDKEIPEKQGINKPNIFVKMGKLIYHYFTGEATTRHLEPYRMTTMSGFLLFSGFSVGLANDFVIGPLDILGQGDTAYKKNGFLKFDLNEIANDRIIDSKGWSFYFGNKLGGRQSILFGIDKFHTLDDDITSYGIDKYSGWGFSVLRSVDTRLDLNLSKDLVQLLSGFKETDSGGSFASISASGSVFAELLNVRLYKQWGDDDSSALSRFLSKLSLSISPSMYLPLLYLPKSSVGVQVVNTSGNISATLTGDLSVYSSFDLQDFSSRDLPGGFGFDVNLNAEYHLLPILDAGITAINVPVLPARLTNVMKWSLNSEIYNGPGLIYVLGGDGEGFKIPELGSPEYLREQSKWVMRPMRWDLYFNFRPLRNDLLFIKPHTGVSVLQPIEDIDKLASFNLGVELDYNVGRSFTLAFYTGSYDGISHNRLALNFHCKNYGSFIELEMLSQDYLRSWTLKGAQINLGWEFGW